MEITLELLDEICRCAGIDLYIEIKIDGTSNFYRKSVKYVGVMKIQHRGEFLSEILHRGISIKHVMDMLVRSTHKEVGSWITRKLDEKAEQ